MAVLKITSRGQVTFPQEVLKHLGIRPGQHISLDLLPNARAQLSADAAQGSWADAAGSLAGKTNGRRLSIDEIGDAVADATIPSD